MRIKAIPMGSYYANSYEQQLTQPRANLWPTPVFPQADIPALIQDPTTGAVYVNPRKSTAKWNYLSANPGVITMAANGTTTASFTPPLEEGASGDLEIVKLTGSSANSNTRYSVVLQDTVSQRKFMNAAVPHNFIFGTATLPFTLFETIFLPATANLIVQCTDLSGAQNVVCIVAEGRRFVGCGPRQALWQAFTERRTHPYWMTFDQGPEVALTASTTTTVSMTVPASADFNCWLIMDDSTAITRDYRIRIMEGSSGRSLMTGPGLNGTGQLECKAHVASTMYSVTGSSYEGATFQLRPNAFPHTWTFTHLFKRGTQIQIELTEPTGNAQTIRLALHGQLIYYNDCPGLADPERARMLQESMAPMPAPMNWLPCSPGCPSPPQPIPNVTGPAPLPAYQPQQSPYYAPPQNAPIPSWGGPAPSGINQAQQAGAQMQPGQTYLPGPGGVQPFLPNDPRIQQIQTWNNPPSLY